MGGIVKIILEAIVGSHAYGLNDVNSDIDKAGIFVVKTNEVLSVRKPKETICKTNPDISYHEVEKFIRLAMVCNPTILELLFLDSYEILTQEAEWLIQIRKAFLSNAIFNSYGGYAIQQARRLNNKAYKISDVVIDELPNIGISFNADTNNRPAKHARHCFRLLQQGRELLETGNLTVKVKNREELLSFGKFTIDELVCKFEEEYQKFRTVKSILLQKPDYETINSVLLKIRSLNV
jgi:hypothetical protein